MKVFVLAPIHNRKEITLRFLRSFSNQTFENYQMVIVDDGSTDGSEEAILSEFPKTIILKGDGNLWWTGSMRMGVEHILSIANEDDYILAINDDVVVKEGYIETLVSVSKKNTDAIVGSLYKDENEKSVIYDSGVKIDWQKYRYYHVPIDKGGEVISDIDTMSTRGALIPVNVFRRIGSFEKRLRHYAADYEYFFRAKKAGFSLLISMDSVVYGDESDRVSGNASYIQSFNAIWKKNFSIKSATNIYNHLFIIWKYCPSIKYKIKHSFMLVTYNAFLFFNSMLFYPIKHLAIRAIGFFKK